MLVGTAVSTGLPVVAMGVIVAVMVVGTVEEMAEAATERMYGGDDATVPRAEHNLIET